MINVTITIDDENKIVGYNGHGSEHYKNKKQLKEFIANFFSDVIDYNVMPLGKEKETDE